MPDRDLTSRVADIIGTFVAYTLTICVVSISIAAAVLSIGAALKVLTEADIEHLLGE